MQPQASILIVDDETFIRQILSRIVSREGYEVRQAANGREALDSLAENPCDIVISDIKMPQMDGIELLAELRARHPNVKVVLITAYAGEYSAKEALEAGADSFIAKPFKNVEIAQTLREVLTMNRPTGRTDAATPTRTKQPSQS